jgi:hypothetical protein
MLKTGKGDVKLTPPCNATGPEVQTKVSEPAKTEHWEYTFTWLLNKDKPNVNSVENTKSLEIDFINN